MAGDVQIVLGVDTSQVKIGLDSVRGDFQGWAGNANAVASATQKLEQQLRGFASEQRQQGRLARFYAAEVASIIPAADGAKAALQGLGGIAIEGLVGGVGIGLGFEALKFAIQYVTDETKQAEAAAKSLGEASDAAAAIATKGWNNVATMMEKATAGTKAYRDSFKDAQPEIEKAFKALSDIQDQRPSAAKLFMSGDRALDAWTANYEAAVAAVDRALSAASNKADIARAVAGELQKQDQARLANVQIAKDNEQRILDVTKARTKELERQADLAKSTWDAGELPNMGGDAALRASAAWKVEQEAQQRDAEAARAEQRWQPVFGPGNDQGAQDFADQLSRINTESSQMESMWSAIGGSVTSAFSSIGNAVGGVAGKVLGWLGQMITQAIQLAVAMSAAGSAWTTPLGSLAIGATVAAGLLGLISSISARADGGPVQAFRPYLVGERGPELIVPRAAGTVIPNEQLGAGGAVNITFNAPVDATWWRQNERHIVRTLREAARARRT